MSAVRYKVIQRHALDTFEKEVTLWLGAGWDLVGGVSYIPSLGCYIQAMSTDIWGPE